MNNIDKLIKELDFNKMYASTNTFVWYPEYATDKYKNRISLNDEVKIEPNYFNETTFVDLCSNFETKLEEDLSIFEYTIVLGEGVKITKQLGNICDTLYSTCSYMYLELDVSNITNYFEPVIIGVDRGGDYEQLIINYIIGDNMCIPVKSNDNEYFSLLLKKKPINNIVKCIVSAYRCLDS